MTSDPKIKNKEEIIDVMVTSENTATIQDQGGLNNVKLTSETSKIQNNVEHNDIIQTSITLMIQRDPGIDDISVASKDNAS